MAGAAGRRNRVMRPGARGRRGKGTGVAAPALPFFPYRAANPDMVTFESRASRRRAELEWQELARQGEAEKAAARARDGRARESARLGADAKTARLRTLRLAREQEDRAAKAASKPVRRRRVKAAQAAP